MGGDVHVPPGNAATPEKIRALTLSRGITISAYGSYYRAGFSEIEGMAFDSVLESAAALGAPSVWSGKVASSETDDDYRNRVAQDLNRIAEKASAHNIVVSCEFHDGTLTDRAESTLALLNQANHPNLRTYWQPRHGLPTDVGLNELAWLPQAQRHPRLSLVAHSERTTSSVRRIGTLASIPIQDSDDSWRPLCSDRICPR